MNLPIVYVKNLPYDTSSTSLNTLFKDYGIHQIRVKPGSCFVVLNDIKNAQLAVSKLNGINFNGRYIVCNLYNAEIDQSDLLTKEQLDQLKNYVEST